MLGNSIIFTISFPSGLRLKESYLEYDQKRLVFLYAKPKEVEVGFESWKLHELFKPYYKKLKIDFPVYPDVYRESAKDLLKDLNIACQEVTNKFYQDFLNEENGYEKHWQKFSWRLPVKKDVSKITVIKNWKHMLRHFNLQDLNACKKDIDEYCGEDMGNTNRIVWFNVLPAMIELLILKERNYIKEIEEILETGAKLLAYHFKTNYAEARLEPEEYKTVEGFDQEAYYRAMESYKSRYLGRFSRTTPYEVFDKNHQFFDLMHKFYRDYFMKIRKLILSSKL